MARSDVVDIAPARAERTSQPQGIAPTPEQAKKRKDRTRLVVLCSALGLQALGAFFFIGELWSEILGLRTTPLPYAYQEYIQLLASVGLIVGLGASALLAKRGMARMADLNRQIDVASGNYEDHLLKLFKNWRLSPSEQAVAIYAMKGFSNAEIADLRSTSASTVKSQMNAIYRKTGLGNRQQLISFLVEELLAGVNPEVCDAAA
ncbi:MAG: helix-turn-helix transcriptional regulator [Alphaproteobacteria bacterium]|nr:helix-turn-helix transcriptional regulator [Alphaproteobacteria bacterium]